MLKITVSDTELYNEANNEFIPLKEQTLVLEHSLVSLSKWESKWCKPFLTKDEMSMEQTIDYIKCMTITQNVDDRIYYCLSNDNITKVHEYIDAAMTATTFSEHKHAINKDIITAEIIYYWMIALNIPFECQKWHLNRLLTLINVCNIKNTPPKKMKAKELAERNRALNAARRKSLGTGG
jgi:hypothetical protein